jgi:hypothetical protein
MYKATHNAPRGIAECRPWTIAHVVVLAVALQQTAGCAPPHRTPPLGLVCRGSGGSGVTETAAGPPGPSTRCPRSAHPDACTGGCKHTDRTWVCQGILNSAWDKILDSLDSRQRSCCVGSSAALVTHSCSPLPGLCWKCNSR